MTATHDNEQIQSSYLKIGLTNLKLYSGIKCYCVLWGNNNAII